MGRDCLGFFSRTKRRLTDNSIDLYKYVKRVNKEKKKKELFKINDK